MNIRHFNIILYKNQESIVFFTGKFNLKKKKRKLYQNVYYLEHFIFFSVNPFCLLPTLCVSLLFGEAMPTAFLTIPPPDKP